MYKDSDFDLELQSEEQPEEYPLELLTEIDHAPTITDRLGLWLESVDH